MQQDDTFAEPLLKRLTEALDGDGADIRRQLLLAALLLMIFERFKKYVTNQVDSFFARGSQLRDGALVYTRGAVFQAMIDEKGKGETGQHRDRAFRAALRWFHEFNAIDQEELDEVERLCTQRNEVGHELFAVVADDKKSPVELKDVLITLGVYIKVVRWWVKEIEASIDPDLDQDNVNWDAVESTDTLFLRHIVHKCLAGDAEWEALQTELADLAAIRRGPGQAR